MLTFNISVHIQPIIASVNGPVTIQRKHDKIKKKISTQNHTEFTCNIYHDIYLEVIHHHRTP